MAAKKSLKKVAAKLKAKASSTKAKVKAKASSARASASKLSAKAKTQVKAAKAKAPSLAPKGLSYAPAGIRSVTPNLVVADAAAAIEFYKRAFGATEVMRMSGPDGKGIWHAQIRIGDSAIFINDPMGGGAPSSLERPSPVSIQLYVKDCDAVLKQAVSAGAKATMPMADQFWGDRMGMVMDPYGNSWAIATRVKDLSESQMRDALAEVASQMAAMGNASEMPTPATNTGTPPGGAQA